MSKPGKRITPPSEKELDVRCPRLGHQVPFSYCRIESEGFPCLKIIDCWYPYFAVEDYLRQELGEENIKKILNHPHQSDKISSLLKMINQAKNTSNKTKA